MTVLGTLRNLLPEARDGIDFYLCYTPLSYVPSTDVRYRRAFAAQPDDPRIYVGDDDDDQDPAAAARRRQQRQPQQQADTDDNARQQSRTESSQESERRPSAKGKRKRAVPSQEPFDVHGHEDDGDEGDTWRPWRRTAVKKSVSQGRPSKGARRRGRPRKDSKPSSKSDVPVTPLAEPAIYVGMRAELVPQLHLRAAIQLTHQRAEASTNRGAMTRNVEHPLGGPLVAQALAHSNDTVTLCAALNALHALIGGSGVEWHHERADAELVVRTARTVTRLMSTVEPTCDSVAELIYEPLVDQYTSNYRQQFTVRADALHAIFAPLHALLTANQPLDLLVDREQRNAVNAQLLLVGNDKLRQALADADSRIKRFERRYGCEPQWWPQALRHPKPPPDVNYVGDVAPESLSSSDDDDANKDTSEQNNGKKTEKTASNAAEQKQALALAALLREARQLGIGDTVDSQRCACGGATVDECSALLQSTVACRRQGASPLLRARCCVCALDDTRPSHNRLWYQAPSAGVCDWCAQRLPARDLSYVGRGRWDKPSFEQTKPIGKSCVALRGATAPHDLIDALLALIDTDEEDKNDHDDGERDSSGKQMAFRLLASMRRRHRSWASRVPVPRMMWSKKAQKTTTLANVRSFASIDDQLAAERNVWLVEPLRATRAVLQLRTRQASAPTIDADDHRPLVSLAMLISALEVQALAPQSDFVSAYIGNHKTAMHNLLFPLRTTADVLAYCARRPFALPICPPVLAESTQLGSSGTQTMASNYAFPVYQRLQSLLFNSAVARPLATTVPLLQETLLINAHYPDDDKRAEADRQLSMADLDDDSDDDDDTGLKSRAMPVDADDDDEEEDDDDEELALRSEHIVDELMQQQPAVVVDKEEEEEEEEESWLAELAAESTIDDGRKFDETGDEVDVEDSYVK
jgi:hypothetical protein